MEQVIPEIPCTQPAENWKNDYWVPAKDPRLGVCPLSNITAKFAMLVRRTFATVNTGVQHVPKKYTSWVWLTLQKLGLHALTWA